MVKKPKHLFFDLDHTLTPSRSLAHPEMVALLSQAQELFSIVVVSGSTTEQIHKQLPTTKAICMGQNGNHCIGENNEELWRSTFSESAKARVLEHIAALRKHITHDIPDETDLIHDRGSQISFSIYGSNAPSDIKATIDPDKSLRLKLLETVPFIDEETEVLIGGSTTFDYIMKGAHKGANIARLLSLKNWDPQDCLYFGDALFPGGNDASVIGVVPTQPVQNELETYQLLHHLVSSTESAH